MSIYSIVLVVHVSAVLVLCAALSIESLSLVHLRRASTLAEIQSWITPVPSLPAFAAASVLVILFSGVYLVALESYVRSGWPKVAAAAVLLMAPLGAITARRMQAIRRALNHAAASNSDLLDRLQHPILKISLSVRIAVFLGIFLLVSAKPGLWQSVSLIAAFVALGLLISLLSWGRSAPMSASGTDLANGAKS